MKDLIIVCAGGFAKEAILLVEKINSIKPEWNILGLLDDNVKAGTEIYHGYKTIGTIDGYIPQVNQYLAMGLSNPKIKEAIYVKLKDRGATFATLIDPDIFMASENIIGEGCIITGNSIGTEVCLGKCVHIAVSRMAKPIIRLCLRQGWVC